MFFLLNDGLHSLNRINHDRIVCGADNKVMEFFVGFHDFFRCPVSTIEYTSVRLTPNSVANFSSVNFVPRSIFPSSYAMAEAFKKN